MKTIAIDFGGTNIKIASIDNGKILKRTQLPAHSKNGLAARLDDTREAVFHLLEGEPLSQYRGIGIAMPGLVNPMTKRLTAIYEKYEDATSIDLEAWCQSAFHLPMEMEMDSKAALLGEMAYGCAQNKKDAVIMILGTGVGTAAAIGGKLLQSRSFQAGALGSHFIIQMDGRSCTCPGQGCLEAYAGGWALPGLIKDHTGFPDSGFADEKNLNYFTLHKWVEKRDPVALAVLKTVTGALRAGLISLIHAYDPEVVILTGGVLKFGPQFIEPIIQDINDVIWNTGDPVEIRISENPDDSVLLGLHSLIETKSGKAV